MVNETLKITDEELAEIRMLQGKIQQKVFEFGNLNIEKIEIDRLVSGWVDKDKKLREDWNGLQNLEKQFVDKLLKKYGDGDLDIKEGTFTRVKPD